MNDLIARLDPMIREYERQADDKARSSLTRKAASHCAALLTEAASALQGKNEEIARLEGEWRSRDLSPATCAATPKSAAPDLGVAEAAKTAPPCSICDHGDDQ